MGWNPRTLPSAVYRPRGKSSYLASIISMTPRVSLRTTFSIRKTAGKRMQAKLRQIKQLLLARKHDPVQQTGEWLRSVVQGYFNYHSVPGNGRSMGKFREQVARYWRAARPRPRHKK